VNPRAVIDAWNSFWFKPTSTSTLAVFRIAFGLVVFAWSVSLVPDATSLFTKDGILTDQPNYTGLVGGAWGLLGVFPSKAAMIVLLVALIVASLCLMLGVFSQAAALVVFLGVISFERRDPFVFNSGDVLIRLLALYLIFAPASAALSLGHFVRDRERFWTFPERAPWAMRLIQIQFSVVYLIAVWTKVRGTTWNVGTAVSFALRISDLNRFPVPGFVQNSALISNFFTFGTLALELSLAILVWNRKLRPWVLLAGLSLHLGIEYSIRVGFYGLAIMSMYLIWVPPERMDALLLSLRRRLSRSRVRATPEPAST
jgi:hypothetical protein